MSSPKDFSCVGGLEKHIRIVKETVLFPLMYGDVYAKFNLKPPRGLLFYGPPGTGKTLVASALAAECSNSERKVSFISRKGSDCLSKWVGESEKKLQKIFSMAQQSKPCIIFFDEVDGLAPVRSSRQDFVHASIVSTLLALMDGLDNNSEIIVIGATNRIDAIDPALRRAGRFDRELYFPLPCYAARKDILTVHIKSWKHKPRQKFLSYLASKTVGFCGSDLQALCAEAVMCCVRRHYPEIYTSKSKYHINERQLKVGGQDFLKAQENIVPASHRVAIVPVKSLSSKVQPLLEDNLSRIVSQLEVLCPGGMLTCDTISGKATSRSASCPRMLLCGGDDSHTRHLGPALLHRLEHLPCHVLDVTALFEETGRAAEEAIIQKMKMARRSLPSLLYVPDILTWWDLVDEAARVVFASLMHGLDRSVSLLILTTANSSREDLPSEIVNLFDESQGELFEIKSPGEQERQSYFKQLFVKSPSDCGSNRSSQVDFVQIMSPKKNAAKSKARRGSLQNLSYPELSTQDTNVYSLRKTRTSSKARNRLYTVRSGSSTTAAESGTNVKRKNSGSGEGPATKRLKNGSASNIEKLSTFEMEELLDKIVTATETWPCHRLESLYANLESALERNEDACTTIEECLNAFEGTRNVEAYVKLEDD